jgi:hypothetical protein
MFNAFSAAGAIRLHSTRNYWTANIRWYGEEYYEYDDDDDSAKCRIPE